MSSVWKLSPDDVFLKENTARTKFSRREVETLNKHAPTRYHDFRNIIIAQT